MGERLLEGFAIASVVRDTSSNTTKAVVVWRFDGTDPSLRDEDITQFCFPDVESVEPRSPLNTPIEFYTFVLNGNNGGKGKVYGYCRRVLPGGVGGRYDLPRYRPPQCLVLLTLHPFTGLHNHVLELAHGRWLLGQAAATSLTLPMGSEPAWKDLAVMLTSLQSRPFPPPGQLIKLAGVGKFSPEHLLTRPVDLSSNITDVPVTPLLKRLGPRMFILLLSCLLTERRVIFIANDLCTLSVCIEAAASMLYPFSWQNVFIPVLPTPLLAFASMLDPFIIGIRSSQYAELAKQPLSEVIYVDLEKGELRGTETMQPVSDLCRGVKERVATASNKIANFLGRRDDGGGDPSNKSLKEGAGLSVTDGLFADVKEVYDKCKKRTNQTLFSDDTVTPEDGALRSALLAFHITVFGDHRVLLRPQGWGEMDGRAPTLKHDNRYFLRYRREQRGDPDHLMTFLEEFTNIRTNRMFDRYITGLELHETRMQQQQQQSPRGEAEAVLSMLTPEQQEDYPVLFFRCADMLVQSGQPFSGPIIRQAVRRMLAAGELGSLQNAYEDASLHPLALEATSAKVTKEAASDMLTELCRQAFDAKSFQGILRVVWYRFEDSKGKKWQHALRGLGLLRRLLISGPESVLAECVGHIRLIESFVNSPNNAPLDQGTQMVKTLSTDLLSLVLDIKRLNLLRRAKLDGGGDEGIATGGGSGEVNLLSGGGGGGDGQPLKLEKLPLPQGRPLPDFTTFHNVIGQSLGIEESVAAAMQSTPSSTSRATSSSSHARRKTGDGLFNTFTPASSSSSVTPPPTPPPPPSSLSSSLLPSPLSSSPPSSSSSRRPPPPPPLGQPPSPSASPSPPAPTLLRKSSTSTSSISSGEGENNVGNLLDFVSGGVDGGSSGGSGVSSRGRQQFHTAPSRGGPPQPPPPPPAEVREQLISLSLSPPHNRQVQQQQQQQQMKNQQPPDPFDTMGTMGAIGGGFDSTTLSRPVPQPPPPPPRVAAPAPSLPATTDDLQSLFAIGGGGSGAVGGGGSVGGGAGGFAAVPFTSSGGIIPPPVQAQAHQPMFMQQQQQLPMQMMPGSGSGAAQRLYQASPSPLQQLPQQQSQPPLQGYVPSPMGFQQQQQQQRAAYLPYQQPQVLQPQTQSLPPPSSATTAQTQAQFQQPFMQPPPQFYSNTAAPLSAPNATTRNPTPQKSKAFDPFS